MKQLKTKGQLRVQKAGHYEVSDVCRDITFLEANNIQFFLRSPLMAL
jgi:hypothetical protein